MNRNVYMYLNTRIFPTSGYARVLLFMFLRRELGGTGTGCLFQFTYCEYRNTFTMYANTKGTHHTGACELLQSVDRLCCSLSRTFYRKTSFIFKKKIKVLPSLFSRKV